MDSLLLTLVQRLGVQVADDRHAFVLANLARLVKQSGLSLHESVLLARSAPLENDLLSDWVQCVTVDESFFFRDAEQFETVRQKVLPALAERNSATRRLDIFSAGCAGGEELYSAAILVAETALFQGWDIRMLGADACRKSVYKARSGLYSAWSLRGLSSSRAGYFRARDKHFQLCAEIRQRAEFQVLNLLEEGPSDLQDLIFFRNVSIYFSPEVRKKVLDGLMSRLKTGGFLIAGAGELALELPPQLMSVGDSVFLKVATPTNSSPPEPPRPMSLPPKGSPARRTFFAAEIAPETAKVFKPLPPPEGLAEQARRAADRGQLDEAEQACRLYLQRHPEDLAMHCLMGEIQECRQRPAEAIRSWRTVTFLDNQHGLAHFRLGLLLARTSDKASARRHLTLAQRLLEQREADSGQEQIRMVIRELLRNV